MPPAAARGPPLPQGGYPMAAQPKAPLQQPRPVPTSIEVLMDPDGFEESLKLEWRLDNEAQKAMVRDFQVEMVLDLRKPEEMEQAGPLEPAKGATVKRVSMGQDMGGTIQNMPDGRNFLVSVVGKGPGGALVCRSPWTRVWTLSPKTRPKDLSNVDPFGKRRVSCLHCPCPQYVPMRWSLNSGEKLRCRRCGCHCQDHKEQEVGAILRAREEKASKALRKANLTPLPPEAVDWDSRECDLWFYTDGVVHPRATVGEHRERVREDALVRPGGAEGLNGKAGRVSVVTPTTDSRHHFHEVLWQVFEAQTWPDKELVIVETYTHKYSEFFHELARRDPRVVYVRFQRPAGEDWSIGLKRNIGAHLATGELIVNFDDDDIYAPVYISSMAAVLEDRSLQAVKLSSWFIYDQSTCKFSFCDPIAWGLANGKDENHEDVRQWAYGYGFSYVFRRRAGLELMYADINLGEDFNFITQLQQRRGAACVSLFHDDFGICLHIQHGGNTSNAIPLRGVFADEASNLDVMELAPRFAHFSDNKSATPAVSILKDGPTPPSRRRRTVKAHLPEGEARIDCAVSATVAEFLEKLREEVPEVTERYKVYRVPPGDEAEESVREEAAIEVLGLAFLAKMDGAEHNIRPEGTCGKQWRQLLEKATHPMHARDRIGLRTVDLWIRPPDPVQEEVDELTTEGRHEFNIVDCHCQKSSKKSFFAASNSFQVRMLKGALVSDLRGLLGGDLPAGAKIMAERADRGLSTLREDEVCPSMVTLTDFKGKREFYATFTRRECIKAFNMIKAFFIKKENQIKLDKIVEETHGDVMRYNITLCKLLADEVYPPILRAFDIPQDRALHTFMSAMGRAAEDYESTTLWLETELLMRNRGKILEAWEMLTGHAAKLGLPPPEMPPEIERLLQP
mmetsp:Transcript_62047/g.192188  ORF Transcript_62047/g.192188 Transcript_62047/m.192188 type:complete len:905 (-) Transcript_62047:60-2774(-)